MLCIVYAHHFGNTKSVLSKVWVQRSNQVIPSAASLQNLSGLSRARPNASSCVCFDEYPRTKCFLYVLQFRFCGLHARQKVVFTFCRWHCPCTPVHANLRPSKHLEPTTLIVLLLSFTPDAAHMCLKRVVWKSRMFFEVFYSELCRLSSAVCWHKKAPNFSSQKWPHNNSILQITARGHSKILQSTKRDCYVTLGLSEVSCMIYERLC